MDCQDPDESIDFVPWVTSTQDNSLSGEPSIRPPCTVLCHQDIEALKFDWCFEENTDRNDLDSEYDFIKNLQNTTMVVPDVPVELETDHVKTLVGQIEGAKKYQEVAIKDDNADAIVKDIATKKVELLIMELYKVLSSEKEKKQVTKPLENSQKK